MILFLTQCFPSRVGGIESLVSNLALELSKNEKIIVYADSHNAIKDTIFDNKHKNQIVVRRFGGIKFFRRRKKIKEIKPIIESKKIKLVMSDSWKSLENGIDFLKENNIPIICLAHGNELLFKNNSKKKRIKKILNQVDSVVANSNFTKNLLKKLISSTDKLITIYPGALDIRDIKETIVPKITGEPILLTLSRLEKRKGHLEIIKAIISLLPEFPKIQYVIAGNGPELKNLKKFVIKKKLENNIIFVKNVNDSQKKYLFKKTKLMIMATSDETKNGSIEGFGIVYLEAAFFSIPSIASNVGGTPEAVIDNFTGKIINDKSKLYIAIKELLKNQEKIKELGKNAKKRALEEFRWKHISKQYLSLISNLTKNL